MPYKKMWACFVHGETGTKRISRKVSVRGRRSSMTLVSKKKRGREEERLVRDKYAVTQLTPGGGHRVGKKGGKTCW